MLIGMVHATPLAVSPATRACEAAFPGTEPWHLLDSRLLADLEHVGGLTPRLRQRFMRLLEHMIAEDVDGILVTCSAYTPIVEEARRELPVPVVPPDAAMYRQVAKVQPSTVILVASTSAAIPSAREQLLAHVDGAGLAIRSVVVDSARQAAHEDAESLAFTLKGPVAEVVTGTGDVVVMTQYSLSPAARLLRESLGVQVLVGPESAIEQLRSELKGRRSCHGALPTEVPSIERSGR